MQPKRIRRLGQQQPQLHKTSTRRKRQEKVQRIRMQTVFKRLLWGENSEPMEESPLKMKSWLTNLLGKVLGFLIIVSRKRESIVMS